MRSFLLLALLLLGGVAASSETDDASSMLSAAFAKYTNLSTYYVQGTREVTTSDEIQHEWRQERFTLAKQSGNHYHYEIEVPGSWNLVIADGTTEWDFQPWRNEYTQRPVPKAEPNADDPDDVIRYVAAAGVRSYVQDLSRIGFQKAEFLSSEALSFSGQEVPCYVIRAHFQDIERDVSKSAQLTFWIEKERKVIRKRIIATTHSPSVLQPLRKVKEVETTNYTTVNLQEQPPPALFRFSPPNGAKQVRRLFFNDRNIDLTGFPAPPLKMKTLDGKPFDPDSVKGHVVLVDFWRHGVSLVFNKCGVFQS